MDAASAALARTSSAARAIRRSGKSAAVSSAASDEGIAALDELTQQAGDGALSDERLVAALREYYDAGGDAARIAALKAADNACVLSREPRSPAALPHAHICISELRSVATTSITAADSLSSTSRRDRLNVVEA